MNNTNEIFISTYTITTTTNNNYKDVQCTKQKITLEKLNAYAEQLKDYLLKIDYTKTSSYDNSDDDRASCSESKWSGVKYCEINPLSNSEHLIVQNDTVIGVVFFIRNNNGNTYTRVFLFDGSIQQTICMGYSASHSSSWTYIDQVRLVKRGENDTPLEGNSINFRQSEMYPSL